MSVSSTGLAEAGLVECRDEVGRDNNRLHASATVLAAYRSEYCANARAVVVCEQAGWYARAEPSPPRVAGDGVGLACGFPTRREAEAAAERRCEQSGFDCYVILSARDDGTLSTPEYTGFVSSLLDVRQYGWDGEIYNSRNEIVGRWR